MFFNQHKLILEKKDRENKRPQRTEQNKTKKKHDNN